MPLCGRRVGDAKKPKTVGGADGSDVGKIVARWSSLSICFQISNVLLPPPISLQRRRTPPATPKMTRAKGNTFLAALSLSYGFSKAACLFPSLISCGPVDPFSQVSLSLRSCRSSCPNINQLWQWQQLSHLLTGPMSHQPLACPDWHNKGFTVIFTHHSFTNNTVRYSVNRNASSPTSPLEIRTHFQR